MTKNKKIFLSLVLVCILGLGGWKYVEYKGYCETYYPQHTNINGVDCSGKTPEDVKEILTEQWNTQAFTITENEKTIATLKNLKFNYAIDDQLQEILDNGHKFPAYTTLLQKNKALTISMVPEKETSSFKEQVAALPVYDQKNPIETKSAYVDMSNNKFKIVPEVYGNNIDKSLLKDTIMENIAAGQWTLDFVEKDFYTQPSVKQDDEKLLEEQAYCKQYLAHEITYTFGSDKYTISPEDMDKMLSADAEGKVTVSKKAVKTFVGKLADTYNTVGTDRAFKSTARGTVIVYGGTYGYTIDETAEREKLTKNLKGMKDVTREPVYAKEGLGWENNGFGSTYIEVDLACQQLWYYRGGELVMTSPFVSGNVAQKHWTITGAYSIVYMAQDVTLKGGDKKKKTYYESHVDYWMPFCGDYGLHDADWRAAFGGSIYLTDGSHGCVNLPPAMAEQLYFNVSPGTPVIVFN